MSFRLLLVGILFAVDLWAISAVLGEPRVQDRRLRWLLCIVALPVIGIILWVRARRRLADGGPQSGPTDDPRPAEDQ